MAGVKHEFVLDGATILKETWGDNTLIPVYDNEDSACGIVYNGKPYYFQKNLQGDIISLFTEVTITDEDDQEHTEQQVVARYAYDAWGVCTTVFDTSGIDIANINPFRYRGYYYDTEIGLYYLQSRYYSPSISRFLNSDEPKMSIQIMSNDNATVDTNTFLYCGNSPSIHIDLFGYKKVRMSVANTLIFGIIGLVVNLVRYGMNIFRIFKSANMTTIQKALLSIAFLLPVEIMTEFVKYHIKHIASMIVTYSRSIVVELAMLGLNAGKLSVAGLVVSAVCTVASLYLPKFIDSINMILFAVKKKRYYWDIKWYGIKYYSK